MNESQTRIEKIDPKLHEKGWGEVPQSRILTEQNAYTIAPGPVERVKHHHPKKADYVLEYRNRKLAVIEAKSDELDVAMGVAQAKEYAEMLQIRYAYSTNGNKIWAIDMGVRNAAGDYIVPSKEGFVDCYPTPKELWEMTYPESNELRDRLVATPFNRNGDRHPRYYQEIAIRNVLTAISTGQQRILLTMATGTGKTYTAFQICWILYQQKWNLRGSSTSQPRILFIADRNILANQARNDFDQFPEDVMERVTPDTIHKNHDRVPTSRNLYFSIFQTLMSEDGSGQPFYKQYPQAFFDMVIIDECHRGGANDESQWRELMEWFSPAVQLGMTATPRRVANANTYRYFGDPVYVYSLKQGIADGYLTPFRVQISESNIDEYQYEEGDDVESGQIDKEKVYTEEDFYHGNIEIRERDEHRVEELMAQIEPDDKTLVFCATQAHAAIIRDMINQRKQRPDSNYCVRVTANDGEEGEKLLRQFQNNERLRPTILTTSQKLSTGVDARNVRNIVLMRPVHNIVEFKQILGRGTRLFEGKYYFTLYDFVGAHRNFNDPDWDGDSHCPICGNDPCTCRRNAKGCGSGEGNDDSIPEAHEGCPICGNDPCTCQGGRPKRKVVVSLSSTRSLELETQWTEKFQMGDELVSIDELITQLFGRLPQFFSSEQDLREQWARPDTRQALLNQLEREGFAEEKLEMVRHVLCMEECDLFDVLAFLAYKTTPMERKRRVELVRQDYLNTLTKKQQRFYDLIADHYVRQGFTELAMENLKDFIRIQYGSPYNAMQELNLNPAQIYQQYLEFQRRLYHC